MGNALDSAQPILEHEYQDVSPIRLRTWGVYLLVLAIVTQVVCCLFSQLHPVLELAVHACMHTTVFTLLLLPILVWRHGLGWLTGVVGLCLCILLSFTQPWQLSTLARNDEQSRLLEKDGESLRVLSWNVLSTNRRTEDIEALIRSQDPDIIVMIETRPHFLELMPELLRDYPNYVERAAWSGNGISVLSRREDITYRLEGFGFARQPAVVASLPPGPAGREATLVAMHTLSPMPPRRASIRDRQLAELRKWVVQQQQAVCVCGDLNITPWARAFGELQKAGLRDSRVGAGNGASWPSVLGPLGIPIDHALTFGACAVDKRQILGAALGSDHRPLVFTLHY